MTDRPLNIVFICTDQQRYDSLGCTGNRHARTPRLDALAGESTVFDRHITAHPVCMPSRAAMMTGCYAAAHGVWTNGIPLPHRDHVKLTDSLQAKVDRGDVGGRIVPSHLPTLPELLVEAGYATAAVGKLHLTPTQSHRDLGFAESQQRWDEDPSMADWHGPYYGFQHVDVTLDHGGIPNGHYRHWLNAHHPEVAAMMRGAGDSANRPCALGDLYAMPCPAELYPTAWVADRACDRIAACTEPGREQPFFLWVGIPDPHHPFTPPAETLEQFTDNPTMPAEVEPPTGVTPAASWREQRSGKPLDAGSIEMARRHTDAMVHRIDRAVGRIIDQLKARGVWDRTLLVFTSDHGDYLGDYGLIRKTDRACRVLNHTPLIVRHPDRDPRRVATAVSNTDHLPTLCRVAGVEPPTDIHGEDLFAAIDRGRRRPVMVQSATGRAEATNLSIFDDRYRLTWHPGRQRVELFDHEADPMEWADVGSEQPSVRDRLLGELRRAFGETVSPRCGRVSTW